MSFCSFDYIIFLPIVFFVYWIIPQKFQWLVLLISSYYFYMNWNVKYSLLMFFITLVSYTFALLISKFTRYKKLLLNISLLLCLACLFFFKYFNFLAESIYNLYRGIGFTGNRLVINVILPVGISFYTFQAMSYVIDVYRGKVKPETHFGKFAAFISFFPQLVAGPIERTENLLPQIKEARTFDYDQATYGLKLISWGVFKKIVIADMAAMTVDNIYNSLTYYKGFALFGATIIFGLQIYCDFSGYSDIAIGSAKLLGINLMKNFNSPYFSCSIKEFWSRWHISLSTWFKDYVYIPLGGSNKNNRLKTCINLLITFLVSGLWHGANWTFVIWGLIHGMLRTLEYLFANVKKRKKSILNMVIIFFLVSFAWIFFRAQSLDEAIYVIKYSFTGISNLKEYICRGIEDLDFNNKILATYAISLSMLFAFDWISLKRDVIECIGKLSPMIRWTIYILFIWFVIFMAPVKSSNEFVYFQF